MADFPGQVQIVEVSARDGLQLESRILTVNEKLTLIQGAKNAGLREIEVGSFVRADAVPQMASTADVAAALTMDNAVAYRPVFLNIRGMKQAASFPSLTCEGMLFTAASDAFLRRNINRTIDDAFKEMPAWVEAYGEQSIPVTSFGLMAAFGCNFQGDISIDEVLALIGRGHDVMSSFGLRMETLRLADTMGWANPLQVKRTVSAIRDKWPEVTISLHFHDTRGTGLSNVYAALEMGVTHFDASIGGLGGCPFGGSRGPSGNICTEDLVYMCEEMGVSTGVDLDAVIEVSRWLEGVVEHALPGKTMKAGGLSDIRARQDRPLLTA